VDQATHNKIVSFIWGIADDVLRDLFKRGKYPDVILPMCVIRRMDAVLEPTKQKVLVTKTMLDEARITLGAKALGIAQAAFDESLQYAKDRIQFGKPIGKFQMIQSKLAWMAVQLEAAASLPAVRLGESPPRLRRGVAGAEVALRRALRWYRRQKPQRPAGSTRESAGGDAGPWVQQTCG
jgi:hypothetical protein